MRSKIILNLVLILALVGLSLYTFFRPKEEAAPGIRLTQLKRDDVTRIVVERRGSPTIQMEKHGSSWQITAPLHTHADPIQVDRIIDVVNVTAKHKLPLTDLARFDLDPPQVRVTINGQAFAFGRINDITYEQYLASGDGVYLVPPFYGYGVPADVTKLVSHRLLDDGELPVAFDFGRYRIARNDKGNWSTEGAFPSKKDKVLSQDDFNRWADEWRHTSSLATEPDKGSRGKEQLTVRFKNGKSVPMQILQKQPDFQLVRGDNHMRYRFGAEVGRRLLDPYVVAEK